MTKGYKPQCMVLNAINKFVIKQLITYCFAVKKSGEKEQCIGRCMLYALITSHPEIYIDNRICPENIANLRSKYGGHSLFMDNVYPIFFIKSLWIFSPRLLVISLTGLKQYTLQKCISLNALLRFAFALTLLKIF